MNVFANCGAAAYCFGSRWALLEGQQFLNFVSENFDVNVKLVGHPTVFYHTLENIAVEDNFGIFQMFHIYIFYFK